MLFLISLFNNKFIRFIIIFVLYFIISLIFTNNEIYCMPDDLPKDIFIDGDSQMSPPRKKGKNRF